MDFKSPSEVITNSLYIHCEFQRESVPNWKASFVHFLDVYCWRRSHVKQHYHTKHWDYQSQFGLY